MPKYANLADHFKAKWQGQLQRCKEQSSTIHLLNDTIEAWKKDFLDKHSEFCKSRQEVRLLRQKIARMEEQGLTDPFPDDIITTS